MTDVTTNAAAPKTIAEKLAEAQARVAKLQSQLNTENILNSIAQGDTVTFNYGRKEVKELTGVVFAQGPRVDERGRTSRIALVDVGEGIEATRYTIRVQDILSINGEGAPVSDADEAEDNAADTTDANPLDA